MNIIPALLLAIPIAAILLSIRILMVLQNRKSDCKPEHLQQVITIPNEPKEHTQ